MENSLPFIHGEEIYPQRKKDVSAVGKRALFETNQNVDDGTNLPKAPKKTKFRMKASKRKKIFGSIKKNKRPVEQKVVMSESFTGESAGFVDYDLNAQETKTLEKKKAVYSKIHKRFQRKEMVSKPPLDHTYASSRVLKLPSTERYLSAHRGGIQSHGIPLGCISRPVETMTEISALTMNSPIRNYGLFAEYEAKRSEEINRMVQSASIQNSSYTRRSDCIGPEYPRIPATSSNSSAASVEEFSLECKPQLGTVSSLSSQSTDISGTSSSSGSCSASTPAPSSVSHSTPKPNNTMFASRAAKRLMNGVQGLVEGCFAPISTSPTTNSMHQNEWNAFCQVAKKS